MTLGSPISPKLTEGRASPMRIGLAIETDDPGGAETMILQLATELQRRGHEVFAFGPTGGSGWLTGRFRELGVERVLIPFDGPFGLKAVPRWASLLRELRLDVLHSHEFAMAVVGSLAARSASCRHVITMHGGDYWGSAARRRFALRVASRLSQGTVGISGDFCNRLATTIGLAPSAVQLIPNGVAPVDGNGAPIRAELGLVDGDLLVLAVGNLLPVKGHEFLVRAAAIMRDRGVSVRVAIAGQGPEETGLRALIHDLDVADLVTFLGYRPDVVDLLHAADVFVMPSRSEGMPMAMIEAMLAGLPIVAAHVGGIPELIPDDQHGLLVESEDSEALADGLQRVVADEALRRELGRRAEERARQAFTSTAMADRYLTLYRG